MEWILALVVGLLAGLALGVFVGRALAAGRARTEAAETRADTERSHFEAIAGADRQHQEAIASVQQDLATAKAELDTWKGAEEQRRGEHEAMRKQLEDSFQALAGKALDANSKRLLEQTGGKLEPLEKQLEKLSKATEEMEKTRVGAYGQLGEQLRELQLSTRSLNSQSEKLSTALRGSSQARGNWGEAQLERLVEMAHMQEHCDFQTQVVASDGSRPDMVVTLPGKVAIPIDAKAPMAAFQDAMAAEDEQTRKLKLKLHVSDVRKHVRDLKSRDYSKSLDHSVDFTVMFLPGEALLAAALAESPALFDEALDSRVLLATPVTLLALLRTVRMNWDNIKVEENAREIQVVAGELFERFLKFGEHFAKSGKALDNATRAYNEAVGTFERRVVPTGRKLAQLRVGDENKLPAPQPVERDVRDLQAPE